MADSHLVYSCGATTVLFEKQDLRVSQFTLNFLRLLDLFKCDTDGIHYKDDQQCCQNFKVRKASGAKKRMNCILFIFMKKLCN